MIRLNLIKYMNEKVKITIQHFHGCPNSGRMIQNVINAIKDFKNNVEYEEILVETNELAQKLGFRGSPTLLLNGEDFEGMPEPTRTSLSCRFYKNGVPDEKEIKEKIEIKLHS